MFNRSLVIGKFLPPHRGHSYLIETALSQSHHVVVLVCDLVGQPIPAQLRADWIKEMHPTAEVKIIEDKLDPDDSVAWAAYTKEFLGYTPDAVFTSEDYGDPYAKYMGCTHVLVDKARQRFPISGTMVRNDPFTCWEYLAPCVRAYFAQRVVLIGAESTGKTTLAKDLAAALKTSWVPEYGRFYAEGKLPGIDGANWRTEEFTIIAREQNRAEDHLARTANRILICDTNNFATSVWHERYLMSRSPDVEAMARERKYDLWLVTGDEIPFDQDGTRDGEHIRHAMHARFIERLREANIPHHVLTGTRTQRLEKALELIASARYTPSIVWPNSQSTPTPWLPSTLSSSR